MEGLKLLDPWITSDTYGREEGGDIELFNTVVLRLLERHPDINEDMFREYLLGVKGDGEYWREVAKDFSSKYGAIRDFYQYLNK